ncbi:MAG: ACT domain-containing protein [Lachnospiraceae bacterium]|nr:ACT domain-containing protein [Lachnospiraceae bacterium]
MADKYYVVKQKAIPEVLLKVVEAKRLLDSEKVMTVQEATEAVDISRSSFYKYKDDIFPFHENARGKTITFIMQIEDTPGLLSNVLGLIAEYHANILTIHQTIPINGVASLTMSVEILSISGDSSEMIEKIEAQAGVHYVKILSRE